MHTSRYQSHKEKIRTAIHPRTARIIAYDTGFLEVLGIIKEDGSIFRRMQIYRCNVEIEKASQCR